MHTEIKINPTHIILPNGSQLALDALNCFTPNRAFWDLWETDKLAIKRAGIGITKAQGQWQGYVRSPGQGFSYTQSDLHKLWTEKSRELATSDQIIQSVIVPVKSLPREITSFPCYSHRAYEVIAKVCSNDTYQLRLYCEVCDTRTPGAIAWDVFDSDVVIRAIARAIQQRPTCENVPIPSFLDELKNVEDWV